VPLKRLLQGMDVDRVLSLGAVDDPSAIEDFAAIGRSHASAVS